MTEPRSRSASHEPRARRRSRCASTSASSPAATRRRRRSTTSRARCTTIVDVVRDRRGGAARVRRRRRGVGAPDRDRDRAEYVGDDVDDSGRAHRRARRAVGADVHPLAHASSASSAASSSRIPAAVSAKRVSDARHALRLLDRRAQRVDEVVDVLVGDDERRQDLASPPACAPATWLRMRCFAKSGATTSCAKRPGCIRSISRHEHAARLRLAELDRPHQAEPAHVLDDVELVDERARRARAASRRAAPCARRGSARRARAASRGRPPSRARSARTSSRARRACSIES